MTPRAAPHVHGRHPGCERRLDVVVNAIPYVGDLVGGAPEAVDDASEERRVRLRYPPRVGRPEHVDEGCEQCFGRRRRVPHGRDAQPLLPQRCEARERVRVEVVRLPRGCGLLHAEDLPRLAVVATARGEATQHAHQREPRHAGRVRRALPHAGLVDKRSPTSKTNAVTAKPRLARDRPLS